MYKTFPNSVPFFLFAIGLCCGIVGCGPRGPNTQYTSGVVTLDGKPMGEVSVNFVPESGEEAIFASAATDAEGKFVFTATQGGKYEAGTPVGKYKIVLIKKHATFARPAIVKDGKVVATPRGPQRFTYEIPRVFEDAQKSPISVEIKKGKNHFVFAVKANGTCEVTE
jgi:hypothetical protein